MCRCSDLLASVEATKLVVAAAREEMAAPQSGSAEASGPDGSTGACGGRPSWEVNFHEIEVIDKVGQGSFGTVYEGRWRR